LAWVQQNYVRAETLIRANARLVDTQAKIPLAQVWEGGEVASADGLRFVVPVRTVNAGPNSKYFGTGRGITYYNFTSDQFTGFHGIVIPGTLRGPSNMSSAANNVVVPVRCSRIVRSAWLTEQIA